jgi:hypothetical protein
MVGRPFPVGQASRLPSFKSLVTPASSLQLHRRDACATRKAGCAALSRPTGHNTDWQHVDVGMK